MNVLQGILASKDNQIAVDRIASMETYFFPKTIENEFS